MVTQKSQYALRALFELARRAEAGPTRIEDVAKAQGIPQRFLEVVLNELKHAGLVEAKRGPRGGYQLARSPRNITVEEIMEASQGRFTPVECLSDPRSADCLFKGECVFISLWEEVRDAVARVYESTTLQDLVDREEARLAVTVQNYAI
ncbi:MAG: Rrf2 family transcriptional regulator [Actinobacteria bacterium RBG_16_64_13]|nr:MAG: Rrf2 family transcriptional regulator [Actinobacteria bacterium RBG_16_64_13]